MWEEAGIYLLREASLALEQWTWRRPQEAAGWPLGNLGVTGSQFSCSTVHPAAALALGTDSPHLARSCSAWGDGHGARHWGGFR